MDEQVKKEVLELNRQIHDRTEAAYQALHATKGEPEWLNKQRVLLADMASHLVQTSMTPGELNSERLRSNLYAILTIADQFLPDEGLKAKADSLLML